MMTRFTPGSAVQTPFGKGVVREVRNGGRLLVEVQGRALVLRDGEIAPLDAKPRPPRPAGRISRTPEAPPARGGTRREIDLHGATVEQALERAGEALNEALLGDAAELRLIHGRSGGRIRAALHGWLRTLPGARFRVDPGNPGVTIVDL